MVLKTLERLLTVVIIIFFIFLVLFVDFADRDTKIMVYDCSLLEYYESMPKELKEECKNILDKKEYDERPKSNSRWQTISI